MWTCTRNFMSDEKALRHSSTWQPHTRTHASAHARIQCVFNKGYWQNPGKLNDPDLCYLETWLTKHAHTPHHLSLINPSIYIQPSSHNNNIVMGHGCGVMGIAAVAWVPPSLALSSSAKPLFRCSAHWSVVTFLLPVGRSLMARWSIMLFLSQTPNPS